MPKRADAAVSVESSGDVFPQPFSPRELVRLRLEREDTFGARLLNRVAPTVERLLAIDSLNRTFAHSHGAGSRAFLSRTIEQTGYHCEVSAADIARIPKSGPLVVVANHPLGAIDGILLANLLLSVRDDVKVMANSLLARIPDLRELFLFVDAFGGDDAAAVNVRPLRQSIRHLRSGGVLAVFPAGEVAHWSSSHGGVTDPVWNATVARIIQLTRVPVLPVYFDGRNSALFQIAGLIHPRCRTALLAHELYRRPAPRRRIVTRVGSPVPFQRLAGFEDDQALTAHLRQRVFLLRHRAQSPAPADTRTPEHQAIMAAVDPGLLRREIEALPPSRVLLEDEQYRVITASAAEIPNTLREIGRLREITFRATGEGSGSARDLDRFDRDYTHLFLWHVPTHQIVGAYRLGASDQIVAKRGLAGLYTSTLFRYDAKLLQRIAPALELGRAFVRPEFQRAYQPLMLLWKGICAYCVQNPQYRFLFGPVSISNTYASASKQLMLQFLKTRCGRASLSALVSARNPVRWRTASRDRVLTTSPTAVADDVSDLVSELEFDQKGLPVLLRQYLKLGANLLAFNVDKQFGDCIDGLMVVDLLNVEPRLRDRFMGRAGNARFTAYQEQAAARPVSC